MEVRLVALGRMTKIVKKKLRMTTKIKSSFNGIRKKMKLISVKKIQMSKMIKNPYSKCLKKLQQHKKKQIKFHKKLNKKFINIYIFKIYLNITQFIFLFLRFAVILFILTFLGVTIVLLILISFFIFVIRVTIWHKFFHSHLRSLFDLLLVIILIFIKGNF